MDIRFKYKGYDVFIIKNDMRYFIWNADDRKGNSLADNEGKKFGNFFNAKHTIKEWIDEFEKNPWEFNNRHPELVESISARKKKDDFSSGFFLK